MESLNSAAWWSVLNSSFAVWFLSSVVIAGVTTIYARYQKNRAEQSEKAGQQRRLNIEIGNRVAGGIIALRLDRKRIEGGAVYYSGAIYNEALSYLNNRVTDGKITLDFSIYPDYRWRSFRSLIFELGAVVAESKLPELRKADALYEKLEDLADQACIAESGSNAPDAVKMLGAIEDSSAIFQQLQRYPLWKSQL